MLPNFFCIGAQKSGTTTIWHILAAHPDIFMTQPRETRFFYDDVQFVEGIQKYEIQYFSAWDGQAVSGEKCPEYLYVPAVAQRIHDTIGLDAKFIIALRSPAQRAFSHYRHNLTMLRECRSFTEALTAEERCIQNGEAISVPYGYISRGYYARQVRNYLELFGRERLLLINFEKEIATDQKALADRVFDFLAVRRFYPEKLPFYSGHPPLEDIIIHINTKGNQPQQHFVEIDYQPIGLRRFLQYIDSKSPRQNKKQHIANPSAALLQFARDFLRNKPIEHNLSRQQELEINHRYFLSEIKQLSDLVPIDLSHWLT